MYEVIKPSVNLLGGFNSIKEAWKASRPHLSEEDSELHELKELDLPVQGFAQFAFHIKGSLAFRELIYFLRPSQCWAQSMRTIDLKKELLWISEEVEIERRNNMHLKFDAFLKAKADGVPQDHCKNLLPTGMIVEYSISLDSRTLANVYKGLRRLSPVLFDAYMIPINELLKANFDIDLENFPGKDFIIEDLMLNDEDRKGITEGPYKVGRMNIIGGPMQLVLAAQAIRKQYDKVYSDIIPAILDGSIYDKDQAEEYTTVLYLTDSSLKFMQSTRTCFFAKYDKESTDSWSSVLKVDHLSPADFRKQLPCAGKAEDCPFRAEQLARIIAGNKEDYKSLGEVNPPCPILVGTNSTQKVREYKFGSDSKIHKAWDGMLKAFPEKKLTKDGEAYIRNINLHGFAEAMDNEEPQKSEMLRIANEGNEEYVKSLK